MLRKIKIIHIMLSILIIIAYYLPVYGSSGLFSKKRFNLLVHYGNQAGVGMGCNYILNKTVSVTILSGVEAPKTLIWSAPYSGNVLNFSIETNFSHNSGIYLASGWYIGLFKITGKYIEIKHSSFEWVSGPNIAIGFKYPKEAKEQRIGVEIGITFNLAKKISIIKEASMETLILEAKRGEASKGCIFPFLTFMLEL